MPWYRIPPNMAARTDDPALQALYEGREDEGGGAGGVVHLNFGRGNKSAPRPCCGCGWISTLLCDWKMPYRRDCDAPICAQCAFSPAPDKDLCPIHRDAYRRWLVDTQLIPLT